MALGLFSIDATLCKYHALRVEIFSHFKTQEPSYTMPTPPNSCPTAQNRKHIQIRSQKLHAAGTSKEEIHQRTLDEFPELCKGGKRGGPQGQSDEYGGSQYVEVGGQVQLIVNALVIF
ncbi:hypothetical protein MMC22_004222 [Lobaria immixta]|nr:hypothetical protein [Lobaria immixta]